MYQKYTLKYNAFTIGFEHRLYLMHNEVKHTLFCLLRRHVDQKDLYAIKLFHYNSSVSQRGQHRVLNRKGENK